MSVQGQHGRTDLLNWTGKLAGQSAPPGTACAPSTLPFWRPTGQQSSQLTSGPVSGTGAYEVASGAGRFFEEPTRTTMSAWSHCTNRLRLLPVPRQNPVCLELLTSRRKGPGLASSQTRLRARPEPAENECASLPVVIVPGCGEGGHPGAAERGAIALGWVNEICTASFSASILPRAAGTSPTGPIRCAFPSSARAR